MPIWLGLKLLGLRKFILNNWKWLLPLAILATSFFVVSHIYYGKGVAHERHIWEERIKAESAKNTKINKHNTASVIKYAEDKEAEAKIRIKKETVYKDRILTITKENTIYTDCKASQEILDNRNAIRAEGPKL